MMTEKDNCIPFPGPQRSAEEALRAQLEAVCAQLEALDAQEPEDMRTERYEAWGMRHEALEDERDELLELLES